MSDQELTDPLNRRIILHDHTWYGHIIKGHPEVSDARAQVEQAITNPDEIQFSAADPDCRIYYCVASVGGRRFAVVADVATGIVKTAYAAKKMRPGAVEWSR